METFIKELKQLINSHSKENGSDTPDFILAGYLNDCLESFDKATKRRSEWHTKDPQSENAFEYDTTPSTSGRGAKDEDFS